MPSRLNQQLVTVLLLGLGACSSQLGPDRVRTDQVAYADALGDANKRQTLLNLVKLHYGDYPSFIAVNQLTAGYNTTRSASLGAGLLPGSNFELGDDGSVGVGGSFSETPSVIYKPLSGSALSAALLTPLDASNLLSLLTAGSGDDVALLLGLRSLGPFTNTSPTAGGSTPADPEFGHAVELLGRLLRAGELATAPVPASAPKTVAPVAARVPAAPPPPVPPAPPSPGSLLDPAVTPVPPVTSSAPQAPPASPPAEPAPTEAQAAAAPAAPPALPSSPAGATPSAASPVVVPVAPAPVPEAVVVPVPPPAPLPATPAEVPATPLLMLRVAQGQQARSPLIAELRTLLQLPPDVTEIRVVDGYGRSAPGELRLRTRSFIEVMQAASRGVGEADAPASADDAFDPGRRVPLLRIDGSSTPPVEAFASARYEGRWYSIASNDIGSRRVLSLLMLLFELAQQPPRS